METEIEAAELLTYSAVNKKNKGDTMTKKEQWQNIILQKSP